MKAEEALQNGELYQARKLTQRVIDKDPASDEAQLLMAKILDQEITRHKQAFDEGVEDPEFDEARKEDRQDQIRTWLERARGYLDAKQYDEAMDAAEQVFKLDPENTHASDLIDQIRKKAISEGKTDALFLKGMYKGEMNDRVGRYKEDARAAMARGEWGAASLEVKKALLLDPEDKEARQLLEQIDQKERAAAL